MQHQKQSLNINISLANQSDFEEIWRIFWQIIIDGDTYTNDESTSKEEAYQKWMAKDAKTFVAKVDEKIVGVYLIRPIRVGRGSHIANCSYLVDKKHRGLGIGKALLLHSISQAKELKYEAIQFNFVVSTNKSAVSLWQSVGFKIIGTIPKAFKHKDLGYVDAYVMYLGL